MRLYSLVLISLLFAVSCSTGKKDSGKKSAKKATVAKKAAAKKKAEDPEDKDFEKMMTDRSCVVTANDELICTKFEDGRGKGDWLDVQLNCNLRAKPNVRSAKVGRVLRGRRLYVEDAPVMGWYKVYRKRSVAYVSGICFVEDDDPFGG